MKAEDAFQQAKQYIAGGVNSPVRAFKSVGGTPRFIQKAENAYLFDTEGKKYIDFVGSWGPAIVGHAHPKIVEAVQKSALNGLSFGAPCLLETELAKKIIERVPSIDLIRFCNSGTEATMSAIRLARGYTKRDNFLKFSGCYHGHADALLVDAGSGALTFGVPSSAGVPNAFAQHTFNAPYNDIPALEALFQSHGETFACVIVEPVAGNMNCVIPEIAFLQRLRKLCDQYGVVLIFDEVMTGFRVARAGAQELFNIRPDLSTFGKVIGGGMPVGAFGGRQEIMECLAPLGGVYQAGTLSGNPVAMSAGLACLELTNHPDFYRDLGEKTAYFVQGLKALGEKYPSILVQSVCGMLGLFFTEKALIRNLADVKTCDIQKFNGFFHQCLNRGLYLAPSAFEALFVGAQHSKEILDETLNIMEDALKALK